MTKRFAFKMYLKPGCEEEYARRHAAIWPELVKMMKDGQGVQNYSIYWDKETNLLFAYQECTKGCQHAGQQPHRPHHPEVVGHDGGHHGGEPRQLPITIPLEELFHMD